MILYNQCLIVTGSRSTEEGELLKRLFNTSTFQVEVISDVVTVELCGALKARSPPMLGLPVIKFNFFPYRILWLLQLDSVMASSKSASSEYSECVGEWLH